MIELQQLQSNQKNIIDKIEKISCIMQCVGHSKILAYFSLALEDTEKMLYEIECFHDPKLIDACQTIIDNVEHKLNFYIGCATTVENFDSRLISRAFKQIDARLKVFGQRRGKRLLF